MNWRGGFPHLNGMTLGYAMDYREVLVTGGTGFVGTHVCRALIARGFLPRLLVRVGSDGRIPADVRSACRVTPGDVTDRESVEYAVQGTMAVVHLVGIIREFRGHPRVSRADRAGFSPQAGRARGVEWEAPRTRAKRLPGDPG